MFKKVLISEDIDSIGEGLVNLLERLCIKHIEQVKYSDDAYLKIKRAIKDEEPFDLLITDLSFMEDHREQKYQCGEDLIHVLKEEHPELKIIVNSVEDKLQKVRMLLNDYKVDGYVNKGRNGLKELEDAINTVYSQFQYISPKLKRALNNKKAVEIEDSDIEMLRLLSLGRSQAYISKHFEDNGIAPSSLSSIEKRLNKLRIHFKAANAIHLVSIVKDLGLI